MTFTSIVTAWLAHTKDRVDLANGTKANYARVLRTLRHWCGDRDFQDLSLAEFVRGRGRQGLADRSIRLELSILRILVRWAEQEKLLELLTPLRLHKLRIEPMQFRANHNTPTPAEAGLAIAAMPSAATLAAKLGELAAD
ncbi:MAG: site-specific recombinase XerD [Cognaticolwellia sp.]|jgi:site-specific recombinase XerD